MRTFFSVLLIIVPSIYFGIIDKPTVMGLMIVAGSIAAAFINLDKMKSFKGAGFEAQMKEAKEAVDEAYATVDLLKSLAEPLILATINTVAWVGRLGSSQVSEDTKRITIEQLETLISALDIRGENIDLLLQEYYCLKIYDCYGKIRRMLNEKHDLKWDEVDGWLRDLADYESAKFPNKESILSAIEVSQNELHEDVLKAIESYVTLIEEIKPKVKSLTIV